MSEEYWATFSIFDHRELIYRNALALFDKVVMPVPTAPIGGLKQEEIDALSADADYLQEKQAAVRYDWDLDEFNAWRDEKTGVASVDGAALARVLVKDPPWATRLQLSEKARSLADTLHGGKPVIAVPVYGSSERYDASTDNLWTAEKATLEIILKQFPVPARESSLESIITLRQEEQFQKSLSGLRKWQAEVVNQCILREIDKVIPKAEAELKQWLQDYEEAMAKAKVKKTVTTTVSLVAIGAAVAAGGAPIMMGAKLASPLWALKQASKPCWAELADKPYAPAGVIYAASQLK